jgi:hypothetical protein
MTDKRAESTELSPDITAETTPVAPAPKPWVAPTFERLSLNDAMAGAALIGADSGSS